MRGPQLLHEEAGDRSGVPDWHATIGLIRVVNQQTTRESFFSESNGDVPEVVSGVQSAGRRGKSDARGCWERFAFGHERNPRNLFGRY